MRGTQAPASCSLPPRPFCHRPHPRGQRLGDSASGGAWLSPLPCGSWFCSPEFRSALKPSVSVLDMSHPWVLGSFTLCGLPASQGHEAVPRGPLAWSSLCPGSTVRRVSPFHIGGRQASDRRSQRFPCGLSGSRPSLSPPLAPGDSLLQGNLKPRSQDGHARAPSGSSPELGSTPRWPDPALTPFPRKAPQQPKLAQYRHILNIQGPPEAS